MLVFEHDDLNLISVEEFLEALLFLELLFEAFEHFVDGLEVSAGGEVEGFALFRGAGFDKN